MGEFKTKYEVRDSRENTVIKRFKHLPDAVNYMQDLETMDIESGVYEKDFYFITKTEKVTFLYANE
jgi:hypothetical protein